jgi:peptidoglycan/LPS O-acetylase OafA/YrhL
MKKPILVFIVAGLVLVSSVMWILLSLNSVKPMEMVHFGVIILVVGFALFVGVKRLGSYKRGEPQEDELSKKVLQKTAAISYYISLYIWVFLIFLKDRVTFDTEELLGTGILAMAATFGITWFVLNFRGIRNE